MTATPWTNPGQPLGRPPVGLAGTRGPLPGVGAGSPAGLPPGVPPGLRRFLAPRNRPAPGERCEMCAEPIGEEHAHVVDLEKRSVMCTCRGCRLLFTSSGAGGGRWVAVPERYRFDPAFAMSLGQWEDLQIPVSLAFFFRNSTEDRYVAFYPSPAGATESLLPLDTWQDVMTANPEIADIEADVEAVLLRRHRDSGSSFEGYLVPIDACYDLVGRVKMHWKGFDGGQEAWESIDAFFAELRAKSGA